MIIRELTNRKLLHKPRLQVVDVLPPTHPFRYGSQELKHIIIIIFCNVRAARQVNCPGSQNATHSTLIISSRVIHLCEEFACVHPHTHIARTLCGPAAEVNLMMRRGVSAKDGRAPPNGLQQPIYHAMWVGTSGELHLRVLESSSALAHSREMEQVESVRRCEGMMRVMCIGWGLNAAVVARANRNRLNITWWAARSRVFVIMLIECTQNAPPRVLWTLHNNCRTTCAHTHTQTRTTYHPQLLSYLVEPYHHATAHPLPCPPFGSGLPWLQNTLTRRVRTSIIAPTVWCTLLCTHVRGTVADFRLGFHRQICWLVI